MVGVFGLYLSSGPTLQAQVIQMKFAHFGEETHPCPSGNETVCRESGGTYQWSGEDCHLPCEYPGFSSGTGRTG